MAIEQVVERSTRCALADDSAAIVADVCRARRTGRLCPHSEQVVREALGAGLHTCALPNAGVGQVDRLITTDAVARDRSAAVVRRLVCGVVRVEGAGDGRLREELALRRYGSGHRGQVPR